MPTVTLNQLLGNQGEALVTYLLSKFCLVRPVAGGTDVGIDLFCETITDNQPNNNFLVQVKASSAEGETSYIFDKEKILYWWRQTLPVFVFLVSPEINYKNQKFKIHVINLTECFLEDSEIKHQSKTLKSNFTINSVETMQEFVTSIVPVSAARLWLKHGVIIPSKPGLEVGYLKHYPAVGCGVFAKQALKSIGRSASMILLDLVENQEMTGDNRRYRLHLEAVLETFESYGNYDMHYSLGLSKYKDGRHRESIVHFTKAINCIKTDSRIDQTFFQPFVKEIQALISSAERETSS